MSTRIQIKGAVLLVVWVIVASIQPWCMPRDGNHLVQAYIGPGAGIALVGSLLAVLTALVSSIATILSWPLRRIWRTIRHRRAMGAAKVKRVVILGLDGLEPTLVDKYLQAGLLPHLAKLQSSGTYTRLATTWPPLSPVAWSSFATGVNPGKHNIFDFISKNPDTYQPTISSVRIDEPRRRITIGKYVIPLSRSKITGMRRSKSFWSVLGEAGIFSAILRVPITFPPERFNGVQLAAMCVPDLLGSQGTFTHYIDGGEEGAMDVDDARIFCIAVQRDGQGIRSYLQGPANPMQSDRAGLRIPFSVEPGRDGISGLLKINGQKIRLYPGELSDWIHVSFPMFPTLRIHGICRFLLKSIREPFEMYCSPVQIDPDKPAMPISYPTVYSSYLARQQGPYATLGLAEDTGGLSAGVLSEEDFLQQVYSVHDERRTMFFDALEHVPRGAVVCVFDAPDRLQHMFWRFIDKGHPATRGRPKVYEHVIRDLYVRMDELVGETLSKIGDDTALFVMSDHGFQAFRRCVDLNAWLLANGYLKLKGGVSYSNKPYLGGVDWSQTRAYAIGLAGIFLNQSGRDGHGIVPAEKTEELSVELCGKLCKLTDPETGEAVILEAIPRKIAYSGGYVESAPDIIVGYNRGYRVSWDSAVGRCGRTILADNTRPWSGDHCVHPSLVPGVLFCNRKLSNQPARIIDMAPTTLDLFGVPKPAYMDGRSLLCDDVTS